MIEAVTEDSIDEVLPLVRKYLEFYQVKNISDDRNRQFLSQFGFHNPLGCQFLFRHENKAVAFATVYFTFVTSIASKVAVLNDLYTEPEYRGRGIGKQLIEHCRSFAKTNGAARLQWVTMPDNEVAQGLYDSLDTRKSTWLIYTYGV
jgi:ribosomal protein S18 acetylase RimI-like enzyme